MENKYVLKMEGITKEYFGNKVLKGVELKVRPGEIHALMGENGAGKSTMINIISTNQDILQNYPMVWVPAGVCIVIAVLGFNFVGDGLRDALDPKARR